MSSHKLQLLGVVCVLAFGLFVATQNTFERNNNSASRELFGDLDGNLVAKIVIQRGMETLEVVDKEGRWVMPSRGDYPADFGRISSLLFRVKDLKIANRVSQKSDEHSYFGVSDQSVKEGKSKLTLYDAQANELGGLYLGEDRTPSRRNDFTQSPPQYVRRSGDDAVYLAGEIFGVNTAASSWLDTSLLNVLEGDLVEVEQFSKARDGKPGGATFEPEFKIVAGVKDGGDGEGGGSEVEGGEVEGSEVGNSEASGGQRGGISLQLVGGVPPGMRVKPSGLSQVSRALEGLGFVDVFRIDDPEKSKDLVFDARTVFKLSNGLVYRLESLEKDGKILARVGVEFDPAVSAVDKQNPVPGNNSASEGSKAVEVKVVSAADAAKIAERITPWVYELEKHNGIRFRQKLSDLIESASGSGEGP